MKRIAVLFGIIALTVCATSFAEAPSIGDLPELRLVPTEGTVTPLLQQQLMDEYDVFDFVKDANDDPADMTVSIISIDPMAAPEAVSAATTGVPVIEQATGVVDVYGFAEPAWFTYVVQVDDASTIAEAIEISDTAIAKYSTFAFDGPSIDTGRLIGDLMVDPQLFTYVYSEGTLSISSLMGNITPADASASVDWSIFVNECTPEYDLNGNYLGLSRNWRGDAGEAAVVDVDDIFYQIDADGALTLTSGASIGMGPWVVGILATNGADDNDADGARIMVAKSLLASVTSELDKSETFEGIPVGALVQGPNVIMSETGNVLFDTDPQPVLPYDLIIAASSHWRYEMLGNDAQIDTVPLSIVDLAGETPGELAGVASGHAIKATLTSGGQKEQVLMDDSHDRMAGFRLSAGLFGPVEYGDVYSFSMSVATDAGSVEDLPEYAMALGSAVGGTLLGAEFGLADVGLGEPLSSALGWTPELPLPMDSEGWMNLTYNWTAGATNKWLDLNADGFSNEDDWALIGQFILTPYGATQSDEEKDYFSASLKMWASPWATSDVNVWIDNMRVYKSVYELDLALGPQVIDTLADPLTNAALDDLQNFEISPGVVLSLVDQTTGYDGTIDSWTDTGDAAADLDAVGFYVPVGNPVYGVASFLPETFQYVAGAADLVDVSTVDHTLNGAGAGHSLVLTLAGDDGAEDPPAYDAVQLQVFSGVLEADGTGLYAMECYLSTDGPYNQGGSTPRMPEIKILMNEVAPNPFGAFLGAVYSEAGLPQTVAGDTPTNWHRCVTSMVISEADLVRAVIQLQDNVVEDVGLFNLPIYLDDFTVYKIEDDVDYFDAELFDTL